MGYNCRHTTMKAFKSIFSIVLIGLLLGSLMLLSSCEGGLGGDAPKNVAGKTMKIDGWKIEFTSNTGGKITCGKGYHASIQYNKTGANTATLKMTNVGATYWDGRYVSESYGDFNYSLVFTSPNQGIWNSQGTFTLF